MKYSELISFNPIEDVIQLTTANNSQKAREFVKNYVMSDKMAENMQAPVIDQLQMEEVIDNKGILVVGNYGTGKSHLMSVVSAIASDETNLEYLQNKNFAERISPIAGKFEVLRIEIGGVTMSLREIIFGYIHDDLKEKGIDFEIPDFSKVRDNKQIIKDMMAAFAKKYPDKGYLIIVDEFLAFLSSRNEREIVLDLEFLRALGEMCSKSKLRIIFGVQEKIFDNPKFSFVSDSLKHVSDRFTQLIITKEATAYVVSERILKKSPEQKALIRKHLEKYSNLYSGMASRMDEFVNLFPIHPSYIDVFNKIYVIENRHILKNISLCIKSIFDTEVPEDAPGIISFDEYWPAIKSNGMLKSDVTISRVVTASEQLEDILNRAFPKPATKSLAIKIIYALSVHRLTTNGLDVHFGLTAENLKDDLCLYTRMPENDSDFLLGLVKTTLRDIMSTVSGQFIIYNDSNDQYYIDVDKVIDYDEKIKQKASVLDSSELNRYFYDIVYSCLEWDEKQYVSGFNIYQYDLNWDSHNIFREGYLFMGLPGERSTAQPERDFYIHIMPPYDNRSATAQNLDDETYLYFKSTDEFKESLSLFSAARELAQISEGKDKEAYASKAELHRKKLIKYLSEQKNTCFDVSYKKQKSQLIEVLKGHYKPDMTFKDTIDLACSLIFDNYFDTLYPDFPKMEVKITRKNRIDSVRAAYDYFAGRKTQQAASMLHSFGLLDDDKINPDNSKYAAYFMKKIKDLSPQGVINFSDLFDAGYMDEFFDKKFKISSIYTPIIFLSLVYAGYANITLKNNAVLTASSLDQVPRIKTSDLFEFKYIGKPAEASIPELKKLFGILDLNPALLNNPNDREKGISELLNIARNLSDESVIMNRKVTEKFDLWGEPLVNAMDLSRLQKACSDIQNEFCNYTVKYNTPAKLNNFDLSNDDIETLAQQIKTMQLIKEFDTFKNECADLVNYTAEIENIDLGAEFKSKLTNAKASFREIRDSIINGTEGYKAAQELTNVLSAIKDEYIDIYFTEHKKKRLDINDTKRRGKIQESKQLSILKKLRTIGGNVLSFAKLTDIETDLSGLTSCFELTPEELKSKPICPHCHYSLSDKVKDIHGQLDNIDRRIDNLVSEWTKTLLDTLSDPIVLNQKEFLSEDQQKLINEFIDNKKLPEHVDDNFVNAINALLKGFEPVVVDSNDLMQRLEELPPLDANAFKARINDILSGYINGKDINKLRIIVKRSDKDA